MINPLYEFYKESTNSIVDNTVFHPMLGVESAKDFRVKIIIIDSLSNKTVEFATLSVTRQGTARL